MKDSRVRAKLVLLHFTSESLLQLIFNSPHDVLPMCMQLVPQGDYEKSEGRANALYEFWFSPKGEWSQTDTYL